MYRLLVYFYDCIWLNNHIAIKNTFIAEEVMSRSWSYHNLRWFILTYFPTCRKKLWPSCVNLHFADLNPPQKKQQKNSVNAKSIHKQTVWRHGIIPILGSHIWPIDGTLIGITTPGQNWPESNGNEGVLPSHFWDPQNWSLTSRCSLYSYPGHGGKCQKISRHYESQTSL